MRHYARETPDLLLEGAIPPERADPQEASRRSHRAGWAFALAIIAMVIAVFLVSSLA